MNNIIRSGEKIVEFYYGGNKLKQSFLELENVKKIKIAVAYVSYYGVELIKEISSKSGLGKNKIEIYISPEFSNQNQVQILQELDSVAQVKIVFDIKFHPKVYLFELKDKSRLVLGSSNLTKGGVESNLEFDTIKDIDNSSNEKLVLECFFENCNNKSKELDISIINWYKEIENDIKELNNIQNKIHRKIYKIQTNKDAFDEEKYDIDDYYFNFSDYELFFDRNIKKGDSNIINSRSNVREKLLNINDNIYHIIKNLNLNHHPRNANIVSSIEPNQFNKYQVDWLGVRYGKTEDEIKILNKDAHKKYVRKEEGFGFQKHACIQYSISQSGFSVNLFHSVHNGAIDRYFMKDKMIDNNFMEALNLELENLKGYGFIWYIDDKKFDIDSSDIREFKDFYNYDDEGKISILSKSFNPDDIRLRNLDSISNLVVEYVEMLNPLYNLVSYRLR